MVGIVLVAHGGLPKELLETTQLIIGEKLPAISIVSITGVEKPDEIRLQIQNAITQVDTGEGVLMFTDMFGGTPSNIALSFLKEDTVEVVSGVNLPMLVEMAYARREGKLGDLSRQLSEIGRGSIHIASEYLRNE
ncbi:MAG: PTS sugar transporter subunit IIA [Candidatus Lernaella stagnicola]|nr:PTS sugar transporter subunit IIA [Candidatus Lernaella stagnicola]